MIIHTNSALETERLGETIGKSLSPGAVVALRGDLGAGKTTLIRGLARGLGITARVSSPTFTIVNEYPGAMPLSPSLFHFDMYRLSSEDDLFDIGWDDYLARGGICCVEWSENTPGAMPPDAVFVDIEKTSDDARRITITGGIDLC